MSTDPHRGHEGPGYASPQEAMRQPAEDLIYVSCLYAGTGIDEPDFIAVVDVNPESDTYSEIVHRTPMTTVGDELHHYGWNACSSACHSTIEREALIVPGFRSSRIHILDVSDPRKPDVTKVIEPKELVEASGHTGPHTVHCMPGDIVVISMLGDENGDLPGGFAVLDARDFSVLGRWENGGVDPSLLMYDFWYQPRQNTLVSSEFATPNTIAERFDPDDVAAGKYGQRMHFWDLEKQEKVQTLHLGDDAIPLEIRWQHDPDSPQGFIGSSLSGDIVRFYRDNGTWESETVINIPPEELDGGWALPGPVPALITDLVLTMDDRDLFFSSWLHGDLRHYDVSDPRNPQLKSQVCLGGLLGRDQGHPKSDQPLNGGPQMLQASLDGKRVYIPNSLYTPFDRQFYPGLRGWLTKLERQEDGTYALDPDFFVDFSKLDTGPARPHEVHLPGGDCTTEIFP